MKNDIAEEAVVAQGALLPLSHLFFVTHSVAKAVAAKYSYPIILTSAKEDENVKLAIQKAIQHHQNPIAPKATSMKITVVSDPAVDRTGMDWSSLFIELNASSTRSPAQLCRRRGCGSCQL